MAQSPPFRSDRIDGRTPGEGAAALYGALYGDAGSRQLMIDRQDWGRHQIGPWVLRHDGEDVGVGGFRIGFGEEGLEMTLRFVGRQVCAVLAEEFIDAALNYARTVWNADRFFIRLSPTHANTIGVLEGAGFAVEGMSEGLQVLRFTG